MARSTTSTDSMLIPLYDHRLGKVPTPPLGHESGVDPKLWRAGGKALKPNAKPGDGPGQTEGVIPPTCELMSSSIT